MRIFRYDESVNIRQHLAISCIFNCRCTSARTFIDGRRLHTVGLDQISKTMTTATISERINGNVKKTRRSL